MKPNVKWIPRTLLIVAVIAVAFAVMWWWPVKATTPVEAAIDHSQHAMDKSRPGQVAAEPVAYRELWRELRTVGKIGYNESRVAYIAARINGRIDRVYADFTGIQVKKGDHLVDIYSPELYSAQSELHIALDALDKAKEDRPFAEIRVDASRTKLRLWGFLPEQIEQIEKTRKIATHLTIFAPIGGTVIEKNVREGQYVKEGDQLYRLADLDPVWLFLDVYEYDLAWVRVGQSVDVTVEAYPGETFRGVVTFIDPFLDDTSRTVKIRVNLRNPDRRLKPAMYASAMIRVRLRADGLPEPTGLEGKFICPMHPEVVAEKAGKCTICEMQLERVPDAPKITATASPQAGKVLALPASALLDTGKRKLVYRATAKGNYEPVDVTVGARAESKDAQGKAVVYYPILRGLAEGDMIVTRGGFLLDSQRQIDGLPSLLYPEGQAGASLHQHGGSSPPSPPKAKPSGGGHKH